MKIRITPARQPAAELDTAVEGECRQLIEYIEECHDSGAAGLIAIKAIYDECLKAVQSRKTYEAMSQNDWDVMIAAVRGLDAAVRTVVGGLVELASWENSIAIGLHQALLEVFPPMSKYTREQVEALLEEPEDGENIIYRRFFSATYEYDYDSEDSDLDDEEDVAEYHVRTRALQRLRRRAPKKTFREHKRLDPTFETVKKNMQLVVAGSDSKLDFSIAFRCKLDAKKVEELFGKFKDKSEKATARGTAYADIMKNMWKAWEWNRFTDENAYICYPKGTWTEQNEKLLAEVNTALEEGKELPKNPFVVAQYRGIAYNVVTFNVAARRRSREAVELQLPIYCTSVFGAAGISPGDFYAGMYTDESENSKKVRANLAVTAEYLRYTLVSKRQRKPVEYDGRQYSSPAMALQNLYTVGYDPFFAVLRKTLDLQRKNVVPTKEKVAEARAARAKLEKELAALEGKLEELRKQKTSYEKQQAELAKAKQPKKGARKRADASADQPAESEARESEPPLLTFDEEAYGKLAEEVARSRTATEAAALESKALDALAAGMFHGFLNASNPLVSTGSTPRHSLRYAYAMKFYSGSSKKDRLLPEWHADTRARHPYVGKVYVSLHPPSDYVLGGAPLDVVSLVAHGEIDVQDDIVAEREASFPALIPAGRVVAEHIARFPSFSGEYKEAYAHKYGLTEGDYGLFNDLVAGATSTTAAENVFGVVGEWLVRYHEARLVELARSLAADAGKILVYRDAKGQLVKLLPAIARKSTGVRSGTTSPSTVTLGGESSDPGEHEEPVVLGTYEEPAENNDAAALIGFRNDGNGCYANAVLQLIAAAGIPAAYGYGAETWSDSQLAQEVVRLLTARRDQALDGSYGTADGGTYVRQRNIFLRTLLMNRTHGWQHVYQQQDAAEAMTKILEAFGRAFDQHNPEQLATLVAEGNFETRKPSQFHFLLAVRTYYDLTGIVGVDNANPGFQLDDERSITRLQLHNYVSLALPGTDATTLGDIWTADWNRTFVDLDRTPNNCRHNARFYEAAPRDRETTAFAAADGLGPARLLVQIKRFRLNALLTDYEKNTAVVTVPTTLQRSGREYALRAFVYHQGATMRQGHYIAYVRAGDHWYEANDAVITEDPGNLEERRNASYLYYFAAV